MMASALLMQLLATAFAGVLHDVTGPRWGGGLWYVQGKVLEGTQPLHFVAFFGAYMIQFVSHQGL